MNANPYLKPSDDPIIELAATDFLARMAQQGQARKRGMSLRVGNLVMVIGVPMTVSHYEVFMNHAGAEGVRHLDDPSVEDIARLSGD